VACKHSSASLSSAIPRALRALAIPETLLRPRRSRIQLAVGSLGKLSERPQPLAPLPQRTISTAQARFHGLKSPLWQSIGGDDPYLRPFEDSRVAFLPQQYVSGERAAATVRRSASRSRGRRLSYGDLVRFDSSRCSFEIFPTPDRTGRAGDFSSCAHSFEYAMPCRTDYKRERLPFYTLRPRCKMFRDGKTSAIRTPGPIRLSRTWHAQFKYLQTGYRLRKSDTVDVSYISTTRGDLAETA